MAACERFTSFPRRKSHEPQLSCSCRRIITRDRHTCPRSRWWRGRRRRRIVERSRSRRWYLLQQRGRRTFGTIRHGNAGNDDRYPHQHFSHQSECSAADAQRSVVQPSGFTFELRHEHHNHWLQREPEQHQSEQRSTNYAERAVADRRASRAKRRGRPRCQWRADRKPRFWNERGRAKVAIACRRRQRWRPFSESQRKGATLSSQWRGAGAMTALRKRLATLWKGRDSLLRCNLWWGLPSSQPSSNSEAALNTTKRINDGTGCCSSRMAARCD